MLVYSRPNKFGTKLHQDDQDKRSIFTKQTYLHFSKDNCTATEAILRITLSYLPSPLWRVCNPCWEGLRGLTTPTIQRKFLVPKKNAKFAKRLQILLWSILGMCKPPERLLNINFVKFSLRSTWLLYLLISVVMTGSCYSTKPGLA